jgi:hypothetical protein
MAFPIGVDYGTDPVRATVIDRSDGYKSGSCPIDGPSGKHGVLLDVADHRTARRLLEINFSVDQIRS